MNALPIGVFDSGIGGLSVLRALRQVLPYEHFIYFADTARLPYGDKTPQQLISYCQETVYWMQQTVGVKMIIAACHTSSTIALPAISNTLPCPIIGMLDIPLSVLGRATHLGVLATQATINSQMYTHFFRTLGFQGQVQEIACPMIVPCLENQTPEDLLSFLQIYLRPFWTETFDTLFYGCTHYPLIDQMIQSLLPQHVSCIDPADFLAKKVQDYLTVHALLHPQKQQTEVSFYCSGPPQLFQKNVMQWGQMTTSQVHQIDLPIPCGGVVV